MSLKEIEASIIHKSLTVLQIKIIKFCYPIHHYFIFRLFWTDFGMIIRDIELDSKPGQISIQCLFEMEGGSKMCFEIRAEMI